jgi:signal transduction histidine kinase
LQPNICDGLGLAAARRMQFQQEDTFASEQRHPEASDYPAMAVHFSVDTKLTRLLGETYRSSEVALKELVDNAWDADARSVRIVLPDPLAPQTIVVEDDGTGMTSQELRNEYLNIASDKRSRIGKETPGLNRKVKGRKGI